MKKCMILLMVLFTAVSFVHADLIAYYNMEDAPPVIVDQVGGETAVQADAGHVQWGNAVGLGDNGSWQLDATESAELNALTNNFSVAAWVYVDSATRASKTGTNSGDDRVIGDDVAWDGDAWAFGIRGGNLIFTKNGVADVLTSVAVPTDQWVHIAAAVSSTAGVEFYLNGTLAQTVGNTANCNAGDDIFGIGRSYGNGQAQWFPGLLFEVQVYDNVLTDTEVAALMDNIAELSAPAEGATGVALEGPLEWTAPAAFVPGSYTLNIRANDPNWLDTANNSVVNGATSPFTTALARDTTYYWRVDAIDPNDGGNPITYKGLTGSFETVLSVPMFEAGLPGSVMADAGENVMFAVSATNPFTLDSTGMTYQWYKDAAPISDGPEYSGTATDTLTVSTVDVADEGDYFCRVTITSNSATSDSETAALTVKRLYNHWQLNDNLLDSVSDNDGVGEPVDPNYTPGLDGTSSAGFDGTHAVRIAADAEMQFDAFTVSVWAKVDGGTGHRAVVSNRDDNPQRGFIIYALPTNQWSFWTGTGQQVGWNELNGSAVVNGEWIHLVGSMDTDGTKKLYVNGILASEVETTYGKNIDKGMLIGAGANDAETPSFYFNGQIDDVQLYNYAIDPLDVAILYTDVVEGDICYQTPEYDLDGDCYVNLADFAMMASQWLECNLVPADNCL